MCVYSFNNDNDSLCCCDSCLWARSRGPAASLHPTPTDVFYRAKCHDDRRLHQYGQLGLLALCQVHDGGLHRKNPCRLRPAVSNISPDLAPGTWSSLKPPNHLTPQSLKVAGALVAGGRWHLPPTALKKSAGVWEMEPEI